jgi:8-oxo-dGTP diphosphatase/2-hydroxy-dATP diphosphatase
MEAIFCVSLLALHTMKQRLTLAIVLEGSSKILLGMKKRGFGAGKWNGFGGKLQDEESVEDAAKRELKEECDLIALDVIPRGVIDLIFKDSGDEFEMHIFSVTEYDGEAVETDEMNPQWFEQTEIPYSGMWPSDQYWLPLLLEGKKFEGTFTFLDENTLLEYKVEELK